jgi:hypothetical protein
VLWLHGILAYAYLLNMATCLPACLPLCDVARACLFCLPFRPKLESTGCVCELLPVICHMTHIGIDNMVHIDHMAIHLLLCTAHNHSLHDR